MKYFLLSFLFIFINCSGDDSEDTNNESITYKVQVNFTWSSSTHPTKFPSNAHFSPLIGATHSSSVNLWNSGEIASEGIEEMAEIGATSLLKSEITNTIGFNSIISGDRADSPGTTSVTFKVDVDNPYVTLVSMLVPSPDWFVGVNAIKLLNEDGTWIDNKTVVLHVYDSGTDDGLDFTSTNIDSNPKQNISLLSSNSANTDFTNGDPSVGTFVFTKI